MTQQKNLSRITLGALGVVFGDIGTSPLYALGQCFQEQAGRTINLPTVLGILSLIFWSLTLVVCIKYVTFVLKANYDGEGGTLALLGLIQSKKHQVRPDVSPLVVLVFCGSALLYGDSVITPSISVLSAVEGLKIATPSAQPFILPICASILVGLFVIQQFGTKKVGLYFGPVMVIWFLVIGALGIMGIAKAPEVLWAVNPLEAFRFVIHHGLQGILILSAVVLCFSGAEALFADLGHFGERPIKLAWYVMVLPALLLNYFGQGALILKQPSTIGTPFYSLVPPGLLYPMLALSTLATIIASQAVISGAFSLTEQAIHMGFFPRFQIVHTSKTERGQVYVGAVNWLLMLACLWVVFAFRSSDRLSGAYGLAVIGTMTVTSLTYFVVLRQVWMWSLGKACLVAGGFLIVDGFFLIGNVAKIFSGAWVPLLIASFVLVVYLIWTSGHNHYLQALNRLVMPLDQFTREFCRWKQREEGTGVFLTGNPNNVPLIGGNPWLRTHARHEKIILLTAIQLSVPFVRGKESVHIEQIAPGFYRVAIKLGFMQQPDVTKILKSNMEALTIEWDSLIFYLPKPTVIKCGGWWRQLSQAIYDFLARNSLSAAAYFRIPPEKIIHIGMQLEV